MKAVQISYPRSQVFPPVEEADKDGLLAFGGDLHPDLLMEAYSRGIFPWYNEGSPIIWWSPDPRLVMYPDDFKLSKSLQQVLRSKKFEVRFDANFEAVIDQCARVQRPGQKGTWITPEMKEAYIKMHGLGLAHSIETYHQDQLAGGLYGLSMGKAFFGESMFHLMRDASKVAYFYLVEFCKTHAFHFIDAQTPTDHLKSLGAKEIKRSVFLDELDIALDAPSLVGRWGNVPTSKTS